MMYTKELIFSEFKEVTKKDEKYKKPTYTNRIAYLTALKEDMIKVPKNFKSTLKTKNITFCKANFGGYTSKTKCIEDIPSDIVFDDKNKRLEIYPISPVPSNKETYAVVLKINNPRRSGLYQFHSFGKSSGPIPVSNYLGSWTININP